MSSSDASGATGYARLALRGGAATVGAEVSRVALTMLTIVVLARLLTPIDFGIYAMVAPLVALVALADLGLPAASVQRSKLADEQQSAVFWVVAAAGLGAAAIVAATAPLIAVFYGEPRLRAVTPVIAIVFAANGISAPLEARLRRRLKFTRIAAVDVVAALAGFATAITLGGLGARYWALVAYPVTHAGCKALALWLISGWRPRRGEQRGAPVADLIPFARQLTAFRVVQYLGRSADLVLLGRAGGALQLGLYSNAFNLVAAPVHRLRMPLANVAFPTLTNVRSQPPCYRALYRAGVMGHTALALPILLYLIVDGERVIATVLGQQWRDALPILQLLACGSVARTLSASTTWVFLSLGTTSRQLRWGSIEAIATVSSVVIGLPWGAVGVAAGYAISSWLLLWPRVAYSFSGAPVRPLDLARGCWKPSLAAAIAAAGFRIAGTSLFGDVPQPLAGSVADWGMLAGNVLMFAAIYCAALWATKPRWAP